MRAGERRAAALSVVVFLLPSACALERAQIAKEARLSMVGLGREQVLACMGPPANKAAEGSTEVWSYPSGNGYRSTVVAATSSSAADLQSTQAGATGSAQSIGTAVATTRSRSCIVQVVMTDGKVSRVNYQGPTGGVLTEGEQCSYVVRSCLP